MDAEPQDFRPYLIRGIAVPIVQGGYLSLLRAAVRRFPDELAVVDPEESLRYADLDRESDRVSYLLIGILQNNNTETPRVALSGPASVAYLVCLLALWKAGASYVPLPIEQPPPRRERMKEDASPRLILDAETMAHLRERARTELGDEIVSVSEVPLEREAYVLFTSGSTGRPKGVPISQGALANRLAWMGEEHGLEPGDVLLQKASLGFDVSLIELLGPLISGATVRFLPRSQAANLDALVRAIEENRITTAVFMPVQLQQLLEHPRAKALPLRRVFTGGEAFGIELVHLFYRTLSSATLYSGYGPTEAAISVTSWRSQPTSLRVALGSPLPNVDLVVLSDAGTPVPANGTGELLIAGPCLTKGYLTCEEAKGNTFVDFPIAKTMTRFYRTGDIVRREGEELYFVGRRDTQLKIRGVRIELEEIERLLRSGPRVAEAAIAISGSPTEPQLLGFVKAETGAQLDLASLRHWLTSYLPPEMIPRLRVVAELPLGPTGKLDRERLREWATAPSPRAHAPASDSSLPSQLAALWRQILGHDDFDERTDFFEIGGHSLNVVTLAALVSREFALNPGLAPFFENSTLAEQAKFLGDLRRTEKTAGTVSTPSPTQNYAHFLTVRGMMNEERLAALGENLAARFSNRPGTTPPPAVRIERFDLVSDDPAFDDALLEMALEGTGSEHLELRAHLGTTAHLLSLKCPRQSAGTEQLPEEIDSVVFGESALALFLDLEITVERDPMFSARRSGSTPRSLTEVKRALARLANGVRTLNANPRPPLPTLGPLAFSGLERFHSQCLLAVIEGYARSVLGHLDHARVLGEHTIRFSKQGLASPELTHRSPNFSRQREDLRRYYGLTFSRRGFLRPLPEIAELLEREQPVLLDFDFTHLPHRREYDGEPNYHAIVAVGLDARRHTLLAYEQTSGLVRVPFSEVEAYFSGSLPNGERPGRLLVQVEHPQTRLAPNEVCATLENNLNNLASRDDDVGVNALQLALDSAARAAPGRPFWFEGIWAFSHDLNGITRYLKAAEADLGVNLLEPDELGRLVALQAAWHRIDTLFENARLTNDASLSLLALREMRRLVPEERRLVELFRLVHERARLASVEDEPASS